MKWLMCFSSSPVAGGDDVVVRSLDVKPAAAKLGKPGQSPSLVKQDSAYLEARARVPSEEDKYDNPISIEEAFQGSCNGEVAALQKYGPPKPACNEARMANVEELGLRNKASKDPQIRHIMELMCSVFNTESALVAIVGDDSVFIADCINFKRGDFPWRQSFCAHSLTPPNHQVMVVEDAAKDNRFKHLPLVKQGMVRFYAGTPIVSSKGHRLGTVCFASATPRNFDAEGCMMLSNMGELVTRELEREWAAEQQSKMHTSASSEQQLIRSIDCFNEAVMFIDVSAPKWNLLHLNTAAQTRLKLHGVSWSTDEGSTSLLWDLFQVNAGSYNADSKPWEMHAADIKEGGNFEVHNVVSQAASKSSAPAPMFDLTFRSAATGQIDNNAALVGAPAYLPATYGYHQYYFVAISASINYSRSSVSSVGTLGAFDPDSVPFDDVTLGPLLGKGGYGRVYRAFRGEEQLAVKVIDDSATLKMVDGEPLEFVITREVKHPNVVNTLDFAITNPCRSTSGSDSDGEGERFDSALSRERGRRRRHDETWVLLEFCDRGCLQEASDRGFFRPEGVPSMPFILQAARDIASGLSVLHARNVVHGDLTGGNVLLATDPASPSRVLAKVADFGLARTVDVQSKIETRTYGTVTHMPPELLAKGIFSKAADSFALGVLLWEMYHGVRAWSSMSAAQIITAVAVNHKSLKFRADVPADFASLAGALMSQDPQERPSIDQALETIKAIQAALPSQ